MATTQIRVDDEVKSKLAQLAEGFETPNKVLRRLLGLDNNETNKEVRA